MTPYAWLRAAAKRKFFDIAGRAAEAPEGRRIFSDVLGRVGTVRPDLSMRDFGCPPPYDDLGRVEARSPTRHDSVIFITARFRSGSTLLWNLFRNSGTCTAYFEPLHPRFGWDPSRPVNLPSPSHRNVTDYWEEYSQIDCHRYYRTRFHESSLWMDASSWDPELRAYLQVLIDAAPKRPVLQCNRIDFRLPWVRSVFPQARIVHLFRHPRDQWISSLRGAKTFRDDSTREAFAARDGFFVDLWVEDLQHRFPFLDWRRITHPYQAFYYIWKLSFVCGRKHADHSVCFERLLEDPDSELRRLAEAVQLREYDLKAMRSLIVQPRTGLWTEYASAAWFREQEELCESVLTDYFGGTDLSSPAT